MAKENNNNELTLKIYKAFANNDLAQWDGVIHPDVKLNSPAGRGLAGIETLKSFAGAFHAAFRPTVDLIDHYVAGDRGLVTVNLHWKHDGEEFYGIKPSGQGGTSVETFLLRIENGLVTHWDTADNSLDLANYLFSEGYDLPKEVKPPALIEGPNIHGR
ncbi:nuclear transport factor 2 family protein [Mucilaginibacter defluvii]